MSICQWRHATGWFRTRANHSRLKPHSRGQALVELALVVPVLLFLTLAALDLGRVFYSLITVTNAARAGAMEAAYYPDSFSSGSACSATNRVMCAATRESANSFITVTPADVTKVCSPSCAKGATPANRVTVAVQGQFSLITPLLAPFIGGQTITLRSESTADIVYVPPPTGVPSAAPSASASAAPSASPGPSSSASVEPSASPSVAPCPTPIAGFTTFQQNKNRPVEFTSTSSPTSGACAITFYRWEFGDGNTDAGASSTTSHVYPAQGTSYTATLTVTYPDGTVSVTKTVTTK